MRIRNDHTGPFAIPGGQVLAPGDRWMNAPESFRDHSLVKAGVFTVIEDEDHQPPEAPAPVVEVTAESPKSKPVRSGRGSK